MQAWLRSDLRPAPGAPDRNRVLGPARPAPSGDGHAAAAKLIQVSGALIGAGQATLFDAWSIADADLATALRRLWLDDLLPDTLRAYAEAQWQRPSIRKWLDHNAAARR